VCVQTAHSGSVRQGRHGISFSPQLLRSHHVAALSLHPVLGLLDREFCTTCARKQPPYLQKRRRRLLHKRRRPRPHADTMQDNPGRYLNERTCRRAPGPHEHPVHLACPCFGVISDQAWWGWGAVRTIRLMPLKTPDSAGTWSVATPTPQIAVPQTRVSVGRNRARRDASGQRAHAHGVAWHLVQAPRGQLGGGMRL
jgi:hypothetical protein